MELSLSFFSQCWRGIGRKQGRKRSRQEDAPTCELILRLKFSSIACHVSKPKLTCFSRASPLPGHAPDPQAPHRVVYVERVSNGSRFRARFRGLHLRSDYKGQGCSSQAPVTVWRPSTFSPNSVPSLPFLFTLTGPFRVPGFPAIPGHKGERRDRGWGQGSGTIVSPQSPHQGLHLEGPDRTFGFWPSLSPAHRPTDDQQQ